MIYGDWGLLRYVVFFLGFIRVLRFREDRRVGSGFSGGWLIEMRYVGEIEVGVGFLGREVLFIF